MKRLWVGLPTLAHCGRSRSLALTRLVRLCAQGGYQGGLDTPSTESTPTRLFTRMRHSPAGAAPPLAECFSNTANAALYVHGGVIGAFLAPEGPQCTSYNSATLALRHMRSLLSQAASFFDDSGRRLPEASARRCYGSPQFMRSLLEQLFLSLYLDTEDNTIAETARLVMAAHPFPLTTLPSALRASLEDAVRVILQATAFSFHLALEDALRQNDRQRKDARQAGRRLVLELFAVWWWANPDLVGLERPGSERFLPFNRRAFHALAGQAGSGGARSLLAHEELFEDRLQRHLESLTEEISGVHRDSGGGDTGRTATPAFRDQLAAHGGFLSARLVFCEAYRHGLAQVWAPVPAKADYITCALLPRVVEVAVVTCAAADNPCDAARGEDLLRMLMADWVGPTLSGETAPGIPPAAALSSQEAWKLLFAAVASVATLKSSAVALRQSRKTLAHSMAAAAVVQSSGRAQRSHTTSTRGANIPTYGDCLQDAERRYMRHVRAWTRSPSAHGHAHADEEPLGWARQLFRVCVIQFEASGVFQSSLMERPATENALWAQLTEQLCRTFPGVFCTGGPATALWSLFALECLTVPSTFAQEEALTRWRRLAWSGEPHKGTARQREDSRSTFPQLPVEAPGVVTGGDDTRSVYCPTWERVRRAQWLAGVVAHTTSNVDETAPARTHGSRGAGRPESVPPVPSFATSKALLQSTLSVTERSTVARLPSPVHELLREAQTSACVIFSAYVGHDAQAARPSLYVFLRFFHFLARLGEPTCAVPSDEAAFPWLRPVQDELLPECHRVLQGYLEKLLAGYIAHSAGPGNALALLTVHRARVDGLPTQSAWNSLVQALLWSGLPANALDEAARGTDEVGGDSFALGSLAWEVLRNQRTPLLGLEDTRCEREATAVVTTRTANSILLAALSHLLTLALQTPDTTRLPCHVYAAAVRVCLAAGANTTNTHAKPPDDECSRNDTDHTDCLDDDGVEDVVVADHATDHVIAGEFAVAEEQDADDEPIAHTEAVSDEDAAVTTHDWDTWACEEMNEQHGGSQAATTAVTLHHTESAARCVDEGGATRAEHPSLELPSAVAARAAFLDALSLSSPSSEHLFHSLVQLLRWAVSPSSTFSSSSTPMSTPVCFRLERESRRMEGSASVLTTAAAQYSQLVDPLMHPRVPLSGAWRHLLANRLLAETLCLVVMHSVADVWWLAGLLIRWGNGGHGRPRLTQTAEPTFTDNRQPRLLTKRMEASLAQLLHHSGIAIEDVRRWRHAEGAAVDRRGALADPGEFHANVFAHAVHGIPRSAVDGAQSCRAEGAPLTCLLGSLLLTSLESRAQYWQARAPSSALSLPEVVRLYHPHNHYLSCFFMSVTTAQQAAREDEREGRRAIWPSRQLFSFRPSTSSAFNVLPALEVWQRDGCRLQADGCRPHHGDVEVTGSDVMDDDAYVNFFSAPL